MLFEFQPSILCISIQSWEHALHPPLLYEEHYFKSPPIPHICSRAVLSDGVVLLSQYTSVMQVNGIRPGGPFDCRLHCPLLIPPPKSLLFNQWMFFEGGLLSG